MILARLLRRAAAALTLVAALALPPAAAAAERRLAMAPLVDEAGATPAEQRRLEAALKAAALDALYALSPAAPPEPCDQACRRALAEGADAGWLLTANLARGRDGLVLLLVLYGADGAVARTRTLTGPTVGALVVALDAEGPKLLAGAPTPAAPRAATPVAPVYVPPVDYAEKSVLLALGLEFLIPTTGLFYAEAYGAALGELAGYVGGIAFLLSGVANENDETLAIGLVLFAGARIFGLIAAPVAAHDYNERLAERRSPADLGLAADLEARVTPLGPGPLAETPSATLFTLPAVRF